MATFEANFMQSNDIQASFASQENINAEFGSVYQGEAVEDYALLRNKPKLNSVELIGNKALPDIGVDTLTNEDIEQLLNSFIG